MCKGGFFLCCSVTKPCLTFCNTMNLQHTRLPLSFTISQSLLKFISTELVMLSKHLALCCPLLLSPSIFPSIRVFPMSRLFASSGQSIGTSASASVLPMSIQDWFPLGLTGLISLLSPTPQFEGINSSMLSFLYGTTLTSISNYWKL